MSRNWIDELFPDKENGTGVACEIKAASFDAKDRTFNGFLTKAIEDRDGDILEKGVFANEHLGDFKKLPVMLWSHRALLPAIGLWKGIDATKDPVPVEGQLRPEGEDDMADNAASAIKFGLLAISAGFRTLEANRDTDEDGFPKGPRRVKKAALWEGSLVNIPSNVGAHLKMCTKLAGEAYAEGAEPREVFVTATDDEVLRRAGVLIKRITLAIAGGDHVAEPMVKACNDLRLALEATATGAVDPKTGAQEMCDLSTWLTEKVAKFQ
jgi:HK97 family phage prohead protease